MKTIPHDPGADEVLEEVVVDGKKKIRVRRSVVFLTSPVGNSISTVAAPANRETFTALKGEQPENQMAKDDQKPEDKPPVPPSADAEKGDGFDPAKLKPAEKASLLTRLGVFLGLVAPQPISSASVAASLKSIAEAGPERVGARTWKADWTGPTSVPNTLAFHDWHELWQDLHWAFDDVLYTLSSSAELKDGSPDRNTLLQQAIGDFTSRATALMAARPAAKSEDAAALKSVGDAYAAGSRKAAALPLPAVKAGKVLAARNMERLKAALQALTDMHGEASPKVDPEATTVKPGSSAAAPETDAEKAKAPPFPPKKEGEDDAEAEKAKAPPFPPKKDGEADPKFPPAADDAAGTPKKDPAAAEAASTKESSMDEQTKKALAEKIAALKAEAGANPSPAMKAAIEGLEAIATKGAAATAAAGDQPLTTASLKGLFDAFKADVDQKLDGMAMGMAQSLYSAVKAIPGMDVPGDDDPVGAGFLPAIRNPTTPDDAADDPEVNEKGPASLNMGGGPAIPAHSFVDVGQPSRKSREREDGGDDLRAQVQALKSEVASLKGAKPAPQGIPPGRRANGQSGDNEGGWSGSLFVQD